VLHRVQRAGSGEVRLHGDATLDPDPPVAARAVLALADRISVDGRVRDLAPRPLEGVRQAVRRLRRAASRAVRAARHPSRPPMREAR
jgi:hypothetical protein